MTVQSANRKRLDEALVERGLLESRSKAKAYIMAGDIELNGAVAHRAGVLVGRGDDVSLRRKSRFVSRGGEKLEAALETFSFAVSGRVAADLGASTGGFTDVLLQRGVDRVYAIDVGYGQLDLKLREDIRVVVLERTNARLLADLPEPVDLVTMDLSFISIQLVLPVAARLLKPGGVCIPLIKPQFEAGRGEVGKGGVVRDVATHQRVLREVLTASAAWFEVLDLIRSPLTGPAGNVEFLAYLRLRGSQDES